MAKVHVEMGGETLTLEEYEDFLRGTGEWAADEINTGGKYIYLPSGCYLIPEAYTKPDSNGAVI